MLKGAIYLNVFLFFIISMYFLFESNKENKKLINLNILIRVYIIYILISMCICYFSEIVEIDWDIIYIIPISFISMIICFIGVSRTNKLIKNTKQNDYNRSIKYTILMIIPLLLFVSSYLFELYVINKCDYILKYNYQNGFVTSDDTYIAILNNKPVTVTLQKNIFNRKEITYRHSDSEDVFEEYEIIYKDPIEISKRDSNYDKVIIKNEKIEKIAQNAKERTKDAKGASVLYLPKGEYAIIELTSEDTYGSVLGEYFYSNGEYIKDIITHGSLKSVTYFE